MLMIKIVVCISYEWQKDIGTQPSDFLHFGGAWGTIQSFITPKNFFGKSAYFVCNAD